MNKHLGSKFKPINIVRPDQIWSHIPSGSLVLTGKTCRIGIFDLVYCWYNDGGIIDLFSFDYLIEDFEYIGKL